MAGAGAEAPMPSWMELWNEWEIQVVVVISFSLQVILFFFAGIRRYSVSFVLKVLLWLVYLLADLAAVYALGHMSSSLSKKLSGEHQLVAFWAPFLLLHLGGQDTITAYALEDNELWLRHLLSLFVQVAGSAYVLYKYILAGGGTFVPAAMLILATGFLKYGERIWALRRASKKGSKGPSMPVLQLEEPMDFPPVKERKDIPAPPAVLMWKYEAIDCFKNKQLGAYAYIVMTAHTLRHLLVKPLIIDGNEASIDWSVNTIILKSHLQGYFWGYFWEDNRSGYRFTWEMYKIIEVELALMYDMLYTKAQVIHTWYGYCIRAISLVCCFVALMLFTKSKRDGYSTPDIVITFALLGGACALEMASIIKAIGSTWTCAILRRSGWKWLANAILFARYHLVVVKDGRWSNSVRQYNLMSFCVYSNKKNLMGRIADWIGLRVMWIKAQSTKNAKLSPAMKEFVWGLLNSDTSDMVQIEDVATQNGYWARTFTGFEQSEQLDWSMSLEFHKSMLIWHIATSAFLNHPDVKSELVDKDMTEAVNTLSDYMMYLLVAHPDIVSIKADDRSLYHQTCKRLNRYTDDDQTEDGDYHIILNYKEMRLDEKKKIDDEWQKRMDGSYPADYPGDDVLVKACTLAHTMLDMKLGLTYKMAIIGTVWMQMLCYAATNASGGFHARQLSNGGEFLTHILLLTKYSSPTDKKSKSSKATGEASAAGHIVLDVDDGCNQEEITKVR